MGDTSLTVDADTKQRLSDEYRSPEHDSWTEFFEGLMKMLPTREQMQECTWEECDRNLLRSGPVENWGGVIRFFHEEVWEDGENSHFYGANYYCSPECAQKAQEQVNAMVPREPDLVRVGGADMMVAEFGGATFYIDGDRMEVGIPLPGAFDGSDSHGNDYDYIGEPVYIQNEGRWVQDGVIENIIHEETHTALILDPHGSYSTVMLNHPDEERRENYEEKHVNWYDQECPECGADLRVHDGMPDEIECGECETMIGRDPYAEDAESEA